MPEGGEITRIDPNIVPETNTPEELYDLFLGYKAAHPELVQDITRQIKKIEPLSFVQPKAVNRAVDICMLFYFGMHSTKEEVAKNGSISAIPIPRLIISPSFEGPRGDQGTFVTERRLSTATTEIKANIDFLLSPPTTKDEGKIHGLSDLMITQSFLAGVEEYSHHVFFEEKTPEKALEFARARNELLKKEIITRPNHGANQSGIELVGLLWRLEMSKKYSPWKIKELRHELKVAKMYLGPILD